MVVTELQKMLAGEMYSPYVPELADLRLKARRLCQRLDRADPADRDEQVRILSDLIHFTGSPPTIEPPFRCDYGCNTPVGRNFFMNFGGVILDCARVTIGDNVMLSSHVQLLAAGHPLDPDERTAGLEWGKPITLGHHVWLGGGVVVLPGVTIGDGTTVGAGSVVTKDLPPRVVAVGNPARVVRHL